ncbi:MAG TPA: (5-formylfuran-3-yl)methyl phosphate synthase [Methylocystis sp.]|nr:(5-formylfuran-3-yl)methyl phosphate synthase [Methylocystis sp.]
MTLMLASVLSSAEARIAVERGVDVIDCKDPARGALGALPPAEVAAIVAAVDGRRPVSAVVELPHDLAHARDAIAEVAARGVDYVKFALPMTPDAREVIDGVAPLATQVKLVPVLFADLDPDFELIAPIAAADFHGVMLDTAHKGRARLLDCMGLGALARFVADCRARRLSAGLAGSLEAPDVPRLLVLDPDVLGFRGALCEAGERCNEIVPTNVSLIRDLVGRPLAAGEREEEIDHVFVRDLVLPVEIGAYAFERGHAQRVRFDVDVEVVRVNGPDDMRVVFSYDVIMDAIKIILAAGHIELVETIAERLAESVLLHERARAVSIEIAKLDVAPPASVGVRIRRERAAVVSTPLPLNATL